MMNRPSEHYRRVMLQRQIWKARMMYDIGELTLEEYSSFLRNNNPFIGGVEKDGKENRDAVF